ncbi:chemotaxis protein CheX [Lutibacter sp. B2]|nr:chemotaxis protein CheX [Lutibacter sp. B2]
MNIDRELVEGACTNAVKDVIETMTGFNIDEHYKNDEEDHISTVEISGMMFIFGKRNAIFSLSMTKESAATIVAYMTGIPPFELEDEDLYDGVAELVNMITGRIKAQLINTEYYFDLTPPFTIVGKNHYIVHKSCVTNIFKKFIVENLEIDLKVYYLD